MLKDLKDLKEEDVEEEVLEEEDEASVAETEEEESLPTCPPPYDCCVLEINSLYENRINMGCHVVSEDYFFYETINNECDSKPKITLIEGKW